MGITSQILILELDGKICKTDLAYLRGKNTRLKSFGRITDLVTYLNVWLEIMGDEPGFIILSAHGCAGTVESKGRAITISKILNRLNHPLTNKALHISSCSTFDVSIKLLKKWLQTSRAHLISGYLNKVTAHTAVSIEQEIIRQLRLEFHDIENINHAITAAKRVYPGLIKKAGLTALKNGF